MLQVLNEDWVRLEQALDLHYLSGVFSLFFQLLYIYKRLSFTLVQTIVYFLLFGLLLWILNYGIGNNEIAILCSFYFTRTCLRRFKDLFQDESWTLHHDLHDSCIKVPQS